MNSLIAPLRIVLVEPRESGNVGAAARAMKNFGFTDLTIVGEPRQLDEASVWWASGAEDVVDGASRVDTLREALTGVHVAVATSSGRGREARPSLSPKEVAALRRSLPEAERMAIVFGRERGGLTSSELDLCHEHATIPTSPDFAVMNLAQAVTLFCYELSLNSLFPESVSTTESGDRATHDQIERVHKYAQSLLLSVGFLNPQNPEVAYRELRSLLTSARPTERDVTLLLGIIRQLRWALDQVSLSADTEDDSSEVC